MAAHPSPSYPFHGSPLDRTPLLFAFRGGQNMQAFVGDRAWERPGDPHPLPRARGRGDKQPAPGHPAAAEGALVRMCCPLSNPRGRGETV